MSAIAFNHAKDAELAWVDGQINFGSSSSGEGVAKTEEAASKEAGSVPILDTMSSVEVCQTRPYMCLVGLGLTCIW